MLKRINWIVAVLLIGGGILLLNKDRFKYSAFRYYKSKLLCYNNIDNGLIDEDSIIFCDFELDHNLDRGGVYSGDRDVTHPSVAYTPHGFQGYNLWFALTPYPQALPQHGEPYENACVFYGNYKGKNNSINFKSIKRNPVIFRDGAKFNSDPDLFYDENDTLLYLVNRKRMLDGFASTIVLQHSSDGQYWSEPKVLFQTNRQTLCPCLIKVDTLYYIYAFNSETSGTMCNDFEIWESRSLREPIFKLKETCKWRNMDISIWHGDMLYYKDAYYITSCGFNEDYKNILGGKDKSLYLWFGKSKDGREWQFCSKPLLKANGCYRSTMFVDNSENVVICKRPNLGSKISTSSV